jgi:hypothetical protein
LTSDSREILDAEMANVGEFCDLQLRPKRINLITDNTLSCFLCVGLG